MEPIELRFTIEVTLDDNGGYIAECNELNLFTCAETLDELQVMVEHMLKGHLQARAKQGSLGQLIANLQNTTTVMDPLPPMDLVTEFKLRQTHPFHPG